MKDMYDALVQYQESDNYPFHMPGHKRWKSDFVNPYEIDITEIHGFDNLHHAEGVIWSKREFFLSKRKYLRNIECNLCLYIKKRKNTVG